MPISKDFSNLHLRRSNHQSLRNQEVRVVRHAGENADRASSESTEFDVHTTKNNVLVITHDRAINTKNGDERDIRELNDIEISKLPQLLDSYLDRIIENHDDNKDTSYFLEMKGTGSKDNKDFFSKIIADKIQEKGLSDQVRVISFHQRSIDNLSKNNPQLKTGLLFRDASGYQEGKSIGSDNVKDGTVQSLKEISQSIGQHSDDIGIFLQDKLLLDASHDEVKEFIQSVGKNREIGFWQIAQEDPKYHAGKLHEMDKKMILCQKKLKRAGHTGVCNLITDHKEEMVTLSQKDD